MTAEHSAVIFMFFVRIRMQKNVTDIFASSQPVNREFGTRIIGSIRVGIRGRLFMDADTNHDTGDDQR